MNVSEEHQSDLLGWPDERKWKLIKNDVRLVYLPPTPVHVSVISHTMSCIPVLQTSASSFATCHYHQSFLLNSSPVIWTLISSK